MEEKLDMSKEKERVESIHTIYLHLPSGHVKSCSFQKEVKKVLTPDHMLLMGVTFYKAIVRMKCLIKPFHRIISCIYI